LHSEQVIDGNDVNSRDSFGEESISLLDTVRGREKERGGKCQGREWEGDCWGLK